MHVPRCFFSATRPTLATAMLAFGLGSALLLLSRDTVAAHRLSATSPPEDLLLRDLSLDGIALGMYQLKIQSEAPHKRPSRGSRSKNSMQRVNLTDVTSDAKATCNDGTTGIYYWSPAPSRGNPRAWFFYLGGGGWCWDKATCATRSPSLSSSKGQPEVQVNGRWGVLGSRSPVRNFNRVYIPMCSSDAWLGDVGPEEGPGGVNWRGARILLTTVRHVASTYGMAAGDMVILGGASAGARGAMVHLDTLAVDAGLPTGIRLFGFLDSPYWIDSPVFENKTTVANRLQLQTEAMVTNLRLEPILRANGNCELPEAWMCTFGQYRLPLVKTPFLVVASQYDWYQLIIRQGTDVGPLSCFPEPQCPYYMFADNFATATLSGLDTMPQLLSGASGVFASRCYDHAVSQWKEFQLQRVMGVTMEQAFRQAIEAFDDPAKAMMPKIIDNTCSHLNCGHGCMKKLKSGCEAECA